MKKVIIFSAPSGSGKTTIVKHLLDHFPQLKFSISATSRAPRGNEQNGVDYYFLNHQEFSIAIDANKFIEWEEVYAGTCYGTLHSEVERIWNNGNVVIFDVDVVGGINLKRKFGNSALALFIMPPSIEELRRRLINRATDSDEAIERRVTKAETELSYADKFDRVIVNDSLEKACNEAIKLLKEFLSTN